MQHLPPTFDCFDWKKLRGDGQTPHKRVCACVRAWRYWLTGSSQGDDRIASHHHRKPHHFIMPGVSGRVVLITGASRGIGAAAAKLFLKGGAKVMAVSRSEADLASTGLSHYYASDLSTKEGCRAAVDATERTLGPIDILVCNHGIGSAAEVPLHETNVEQWKLSMATNLDGPFYLTRLVLPGMVERGYGRCVYTSSTAATEAEPSAVGYNTSKVSKLRQISFMFIMVFSSYCML